MGAAAIKLLPCLLTDISALRFIKSANSERESDDDLFARPGVFSLRGFVTELSLPCFGNGELIFRGASVCGFYKIAKRSVEVASNG